VLIGRKLSSYRPPQEVLANASTQNGGPLVVSRALASSSTSSSSSGSASQSSAKHGSGHSGGHQHDALLFLFNAFVLGTVVTHLTSFKMFESLQQTVVLFSIGVVYSFVQEGLGASAELGVAGRSYNMWMDIDPHLILFTMLPALLTGDAMTLDTSVARRVAKQCVYLASVGVFVNSFLTAAFLYWYLPYEWTFLLSLTTGAILCATDPVAVVALLKELGASPTLTVLIQGESLLNDGTAIVLYTIAYNI
jgi:NhaP-type Na+/H+ and K+/H+ antiporter